MVFENPQFCWLINCLCHLTEIYVGITWHAVLFSLDGVSGCGGGFEVVGGGVRLHFSLHVFPLPVLIRLLHGTLSPEEKPWVGVCNFWWMNTSLTHSSFIWLFNLDSLSLFFLYRSFVPSPNRLFSHSGLCYSLKTVVVDLIGLCWTLALCCISYDHLGASLTQASCEV